MMTLVPTTEHNRHAGPEQTKPDDMLGLAIRLLLRTTNYPALRKLHFAVADREVTITGTVPSYFLKQLAQEVALRCKRVRGVTNLVEVRRTESVSPFEPDGQES